MPALRKTFGYSLQISARRIVQSDFSILPCEASETVIRRTPTHIISMAHAPQKRCLQTENQKIALNDLREATSSHLSEDCVSCLGRSMHGLLSKN